MNKKKIQPLSLMGTCNLIFILFVFTTFYLMSKGFLDRKDVGNALIFGGVLYACLITWLTSRRSKGRKK